MLGKKNNTGLYGAYRTQQQEAEKIERKAPTQNGAVTRVGREDVCVYSLRHGTGTSYIASAIANYLASHRKGTTSVVLADTDFAEETVGPRVDVYPWAREGEAFVGSNYIVHDIGVQGELSSDRRTALQRGSTKILVCKADGRYLSRLAEYVENNETEDVIFLFNELPAEWERKVYDIMDFTKNVYCIPTFYAITPGAHATKIFNDIFKRK